MIRNLRRRQASHPHRAREPKRGRKGGERKSHVSNSGGGGGETKESKIGGRAAKVKCILLRAGSKSPEHILLTQNAISTRSLTLNTVSGKTVILYQIPTWMLMYEYLYRLRRNLRSFRSKEIGLDGLRYIMASPQSTACKATSTHRVC